MRYVLAFAMVLSLCVLAWSEGDGGSPVLGSCGTTTENEPAPLAAGPQVGPVLVPGQHAINFELPAVVGSEIKKVKLSDYAGKWRVLCFYPADFTFV